MRQMSPLRLRKGQQVESLIESSGRVPNSARNVVYFEKAWEFLVLILI